MDIKRFCTSSRKDGMTAPDQSWTETDYEVRMAFYTVRSPDMVMMYEK
jgi:hypothetical protein